MIEAFKVIRPPVPESQERDRIWQAQVVIRKALEDLAPTIRAGRDVDAEEAIDRTLESVARRGPRPEIPPDFRVYAYLKRALLRHLGALQRKRGTVVVPGRRRDEGIASQVAAGELDPIAELRALAKRTASELRADAARNLHQALEEMLAMAHAVVEAGPSEQDSRERDRVNTSHTRARHRLLEQVAREEETGQTGAGKAQMLRWWVGTILRQRKSPGAGAPEPPAPGAGRENCQ